VSTTDLVRPRRAAKRIIVEAQPQAIAFDLNRVAVVVIDMQNDFCSPNGWFDARGVDLSGARALFPTINRLTATARCYEVPVIWLNWGTRADLLNMHPASRKIARPFPGDASYASRLSNGKGPVLERDSWGAAICPELEVHSDDIVVFKHRLSGFWDNELDSILRNLDVTTLFVGGINLDRCVFATIQDANFSGYDPILVEDASSTYSPKFCVESTLFLIERMYGFITKSHVLISAIETFEPARNEAAQ
jgi:nicotinamidase-related amidase